MVTREAVPINESLEAKLPDIPKSEKLFEGDINAAVITVQQITGFEISPEWWITEVGNDGSTQDILKRFDTAFEKFVRSKMGLEAEEAEDGALEQATASEIVAEADAELARFDEKFADDPGSAPLRTEFIDELGTHLKSKYNLTDEQFNLGHDTTTETDAKVVEQTEAKTERLPSTKKRVKSMIEQLAEDSESDTEALDGIMTTDPERDREDLPEDYVEHKAERTAISAVVIREATTSLVTESRDESDGQPAYQFKFVSHSEKPDKVDGLFDDIEELFKAVGQQIDEEPGKLERAASRYSTISENLDSSFPQTIGEAVSQGGETLRTVFEGIVREVQDELSNRTGLDKEARRQFTLNSLTSALKIKGFNLGHIQVAFNTPSKSLREYIHKREDGLTVDGLPPKPETGLYGETLGCPASLTKDESGNHTMLDIYASAVADALAERDII